MPGPEAGAAGAEVAPSGGSGGKVDGNGGAAGKTNPSGGGPVTGDSAGAAGTTNEGGAAGELGEAGAAGVPVVPVPVDMGTCGKLAGNVIYVESGDTQENLLKGIGRHLRDYVQCQRGVLSHPARAR